MDGPPVNAQVRFRGSGGFRRPRRARGTGADPGSGLARSGRQGRLGREPGAASLLLKRGVGVRAPLVLPPIDPADDGKVPRRGRPIAIGDTEANSVADRHRFDAAIAEGVARDATGWAAIVRTYRSHPGRGVEPLYS